nr:Uma2 family endonuclease [Pyrinomonadaceae bacterium]
VELRSESDTLNSLHEKMREYIENGARLGWLIDPSAKRVYIYRPNQAVECLEQPETIAADPVLRGFVLRMQDIW